MNSTSTYIHHFIYKELIKSNPLAEGVRIYTDEYSSISGKRLYVRIKDYNGEKELFKISYNMVSLNSKIKSRKYGKLLIELRRKLQKAILESRKQESNP